MMIFKKAFILAFAVSLGVILGVGLTFVLFMLVAAMLEELINRF